MRDATDVIYEFDTAYNHYQVVDMVYEGRPARVLFSGRRQAAQSGIATDTQTELLFDYNQRLFELVTGMQPCRLLIIGGGMYTLPSAVLDDLTDIAIDVIELDADLDAVAARYFGLQPDPRMTIIHADGLEHLRTNQTPYDMIIIDAYTHDLAEPTLGSPEAVELLASNLTADGIVAANVIAAYFGRRSQVLRRLMDEYHQYFNDVVLFPASQSLSLWLPQNLVLTAALSAKQDIDRHIRYQRLEGSARPFDLGRDLRL